MNSERISATSVPTGRSVEHCSTVGLSRIALCLFISVVLGGLAAAQVATCPLSSPGGSITHIVYIQFDNLHYERDNPNVPSDLEQMPNLYNFLTGNGTLFTNHHTPLISHTADDILTSLTGVYPDRHGQAVANSFVSQNLPSNKFWDEFPSSFTYWTDQVETNTTEDTAYSMITAAGQNAPAPWVPFTRAGCNVGAVSIANMEMENVTSDLVKIYGECTNGTTTCTSSGYTPQYAEYKSSSSQAASDFEGIAIHCAASSSLCSTAGNVVAEPDVLPQEPNGYTGYSALYGHKYVAPAINNGNSYILDLNGNQITGFPGFGPISPAQALAYDAQMLENGVPIVYTYISDAHDCHTALPTCTLSDGFFRALGPGEASYESQLQTYNAAFGLFFQRLANDGIDASNTLFIVSADEQDHFVAGPASPAGCDGVTTPCNYVYPNGYTPVGNDSPSGLNLSIGEVEGDLTQLYQQQFPSLIPPSSSDSKGPDSGLTASGIFDFHYDMAPAVSLNPYLSSNTPSFARQLERATSQLTAPNPITGNTDHLTNYLVDSAGLNALHMITGDPARTPTFVMFGNTDWYFQEQAEGTIVEQPQDYAYNHGGVAPEINTTWVGFVGPGVQNNGVDSTTWSDHTDIRPTILYLTGLTDDYQSDGRVLVEDLVPSALPASLQSNLQSFEQLAAAYKQMNAPVGAFGQAALQGSTVALASGSTSSDALYSTYESNLNQLTAQRNSLAAQIKTQLNAAEFQSATLNPATVSSITTQATELTAQAQQLVTNLNATPLAPGSIQVSRVQYDGVNSNLGNGDTYTSPYSFPEIFNDQAGLTGTTNGIQNIAGIQGSVFIDQFNTIPGSALAGTLALPSSGAPATFPTQEPGSYITTSFSSKSEGALMVAPGSNYMTYMGYEGNDTMVDVSNSYSPSPLYELNPNIYTDSNNVPYPFYDREVALIGPGGLLSLTPIDNADSGDNPRAAITVDGNEFYTAGNSDSTEKPVTVGGVTYGEPGLTIGVRCGTPALLNGNVNPDSNLSYQLGTYLAADRTDESAKQHVKDNNWRGIGIYNDANGNPQLYVSKGSGGNGDDGVFLVQVNGGLPPCTTTTNGAEPTGAAAATFTPVFSAPVTNQITHAPTPYLPFGFWFANPTTLYVADEGNPGSYTGGAAVSFSNATNGTYVPSNDPYAGLEKWSLINGTWTLDYTIQAGLNFNQPQSFPNYNDINGNPIQSYTYGLRNMTGVNNGDGSVTIFAITSQFSAVSGGEPDPTSLVGITDSLAATTLPANEQFVSLQTSSNQEVFRGVAYVPSTAARQTQTITFPNPGPVASGVAPITLTASATSGWPIAYSLISGPATLTGNVLTITGSGSVVVEADQSGNAAFAPAPPVQDTVVVNALNQTVSFTTNAPASAVFNSSFTVAATASSGLPITYSSDGVVCTNSGPLYTMISGTGTCTVSATQAGNASYAAASASESTNAVKASQTVSFTTNAPTSAVYNSSFTVAATSSSGLSATFTNAGSCSNSGATYTITSGTGTCTVTANQPGDADYLAASPVSESTAAQRAAQTVTFTGGPASAPYAGAFTLVASTNSTAVAYITGTNPTTCALSGPYSPVTVTILKDSGKCIFTASWGADANYNPASAMQTTTATKAASTITWAPPAAITYGTPLSSTQLDASGIPAGGTYTYSPASGAIEEAGTVTLKVTYKPSNSDYSNSTDTVALQVLQAPTTTAITSSSSTVTMNFDGVASATLDFNVTSYKPTGAVTLTATTGELCSGKVSAATGNGSCKLTFTTTGPRTITATYGGDGNHNGSNSSGQNPAVTVTVNPH